ncbi:LysM peptidoglycan-binding domain-containing protein [Streptomyces sp. N2-109]|uniref:LysM peptidoglycan-binding domain-containing protein n=1 Tax=Streptomyces gossypii TaxID=2883101 RepID=A0ABT2JMJ0_9ACTN|nr:LysM peptidoglycan-binding domain-containing protein [Streptomyces gossypii]
MAGDTLYDLAQRYGITGGWPALHEANREAVGPDPRYLQIGTELVIPGAAG